MIQYYDETVTHLFLLTVSLVLVADEKHKNAASCDLRSEDERYIPIVLSRAGTWCSPRYRSLSLSSTDSRSIQPDEGLNIWGKSNSIRGKLVLRNGSGRPIAKLYKNPTSSVAASFVIYTESPQHDGQRSCTRVNAKGTILYKWAEVVADPHAKLYTLCEVVNKCNLCVPRFWATTTLDDEVHLRSEQESQVAIMTLDEKEKSDSSVSWKVLVNPSAWKEDTKLLFCFMSIIDEMKENHSVGNMARSGSGADLVTLDKILVSTCSRRTLSLSEQLAVPALLPRNCQENIVGEQSKQSVVLQQQGNRRRSSSLHHDWPYKGTSASSSSF
jgi:hypothetical protein